jgi:hypothetical protein
MSRSVRLARSQAAAQSLNNVTFELADSRDAEINEMFDVGVCLYDVIGSYADDHDNFQVFKNLVRHIKPGGYILLSVMNMELTERRAKHWFSIDSEPDKLLTLRPSDTMEKTGNVFDPDNYLIDQNTRIVYRKEQFAEGAELPEIVGSRQALYQRRNRESVSTSRLGGYLDAFRAHGLVATAVVAVG